MDKVIWRKNFDILRVDFNLPVETGSGFGGLNYLTVGKNVISQMIWVTKDMNNVGSYFPKHELRELIELTMKEILTNPLRIRKVHKKAIQLNWQYFKLAQKIRKLNIPKLTNRQLLFWRDKLFQLQYISHCLSLPTTWYLDSDGEDFSKYMAAFLKKRIDLLGLNLNPAAVFSVLSTPNEESFTAKEELESLRILDWIRSKPILKHWFMNHSTKKLVKFFPTLPKAWKQKILVHYQKWLWTPYTYIGPAYDLDYYLEVWRGLLHEDENPKAKLKSLKLKNKQVQELRKKYSALLKLSPLEKQWLGISAEVVWVKGLRKEVFFHGFFVLDLLLKEIGKRSGLSLIQTKYLLPRELKLVLAGKDYANIANERIKFSVIYEKTLKGKNLKWSDKGLKVFVGKQAKKFLSKQEFEKIKVIKTDTLTGSCACPGIAKGIVKIVNLPEEMSKMKQGDIMLAHTTFPSLVPAMKKASAIITEDGGITCHAAIVAREMQTPCIVGCKNAIAIFKDGDFVEVDANKGIVKKL